MHMHIGMPMVIFIIMAVRSFINAISFPQALILLMVADVTRFVKLLVHQIASYRSCVVSAFSILLGLIRILGMIIPQKPLQSAYA